MRRTLLPFVVFVGVIGLGEAVVACGEDDVTIPATNEPDSASPGDPHEDSGTHIDATVDDEPDAGEDVDAGDVADAGEDADAGDVTDAGSDADAGDVLDAGGDADADASGPTTLRIVAANLTSGNAQSYDPGEGIRILQGLKPDIALLQELNYKTNSDEDLRTFVTKAFGAEYTYARESGQQIPNGVVSRYPIVASGRWDDPEVSNRGFVYAKISLPGERALWAVSVHFLTRNASTRNQEAVALRTQLNAVVGPSDYLVIGGNFNTDNRSESCVSTLGAIVTTSAPHPADANGNGNTNASRTKPYDWVLVNPALAAHRVPTVIGASQFSNGLVFDSRVYTPLSEVAPVLSSDSAATNMQHMAVVKDFLVP